MACSDSMFLRDMRKRIVVDDWLGGECVMHVKKGLEMETDAMRGV